MSQVQASACLTSCGMAARMRSVQAEYLPVIKAKQRTAFPPNYVHSLDSAHMMLTAIACSKAGAPVLHFPCSRCVPGRPAGV
jgi:hypothetical protein